MILPLNVDMLTHAYDYLCATEPFNKWNMPPSEDIKFSINRKSDRFAHYQLVDGVHNIAISSRFVGTHEMLLATLSHELIHLHMCSAKISDRTQHGKAFQKFADRICKIHGFDRLNF